MIASLCRLDCNKSALWYQWNYVAIIYSVFFCICVCLHMLCIKVNRKQVWRKHTRQQNEIRSWKSWISKSNGTRTTLAKVGSKRVWEWATRSTLWAGRPSLVPPCLILCPQSSLWPIWSIFTYLAFCFEPNQKSLDKHMRKDHFSHESKDRFT